MKIALAILHADPARGGAERYTLDLAKALAGRGHEITLLSVAPSPKDEGVVSSESDPFQRIRLKGGGLTRTRRYRRFIDSLDTHLQSNQYDIVHAMLPVRRCDVYHPHAGVAAREAEKPSVLFNPRRRAMAEVEQALIAGDQPPVVICLSEYVARDLHAFYPTARTATLFNAVNLQTFDPARRPTAGAEIRERFGLKRDDTIALMIAQDFERKGLRQSIEALAQLPNLRLLVVGQGKTAPYKRLAERLKVRDRITFAGSTDDPHAFYAASDFFILPTRHDPCSLVVLEALAMGLPVISTVFNGATEIMENGLHGFILSSADDMPALARAMQDCCDASRRQIMSQACLALRPKLSYETHLDTLEAIYHRQQARK